MNLVWNQPTRRKQILFWVLLLGLIAAGAFLRLWNLGAPSFWVDEVEFWSASQSWLDTGELTMESGYLYERAPLYSYVTALFFKIAGAGETTTRLTAALFGILSLFLVYVLARHLFSRRTALMAVFLASFSHFEIGWARTARMYTLLQFFTLLLAYAFIRGFEAVGERGLFPEPGGLLPQRNPEKSPFWRRWGIRPLWFLGFLLIGFAAYYYVHMLALFVFFSLFVYCGFMALVYLVMNQSREKFLNKYSLAFFGGLAVLLLAVAAVPVLREMAGHFFSYTPPWAESQASALNRLALMEFLIEGYRFPLAALFFIGMVQIFFRGRKRASTLIFLFLVPLFLLSFVFTHRVAVYIYNVYPMFLIIAAFGFIQILEREEEILKKWMQGIREKGFETGRGLMKTAPFLLMVVLLSVFVFSPWFRISLNIPFHGDGFTNMAVSFSEWREGSRMVLEEREAEDLVLASLPATTSYYGLKADYTLNWSLLLQAQDKEYRNEADRWIDFYAGVVCIESLVELEDIVSSNPRGWIILNRYHFEHTDYMPEAVRQFLLNRMGEPAETARKTVLVFHWEEESQ
jgi:uncharacterized membrane protein